MSSCQPYHITSRVIANMQMLNMAGYQKTNQA